MSTDGEATGWPDGLMRVLTITWPRSRPLHTAEIGLCQHDTGIPLLAVTKMVLTAAVGNEPITAELTMLVNDDGLPIDLYGHGPVALDETGEPRMGVFQWLVADMRIVNGPEARVAIGKPTYACAVAHFDKHGNTIPCPDRAH